MYIKIAKIERTVINVTSLCFNLTNKVSLIFRRIIHFETKKKHVDTKRYKIFVSKLVTAETKKEKPVLWSLKDIIKKIMDKIHQQAFMFHSNHHLHTKLDIRIHHNNSNILSNVSLFFCFSVCVNLLTKIVCRRHHNTKCGSKSQFNIMPILPSTYCN